jgi:FkbM family methyltransferase
MNLRSLLNTALEPLGVQLHRTPGKCLGVYPFRDMQRLATTDAPLVIDAGANRGQTIGEFRHTFPRSVIHSFEPGPTAFRMLQQNRGHPPGVHLNHMGLGSDTTTRQFYEGEFTESSSFLPFDQTSRGQVADRVETPITSVDDYCRGLGIDQVDILKSDTQGYDLEVLRGARCMLDDARIQLVYLELIFSQMYEGQARLDGIYEFLADRGYELVAFYRFNFVDDRANAGDALFIHSDYVAATKGRETQQAA